MIAGTVAKPDIKTLLPAGLQLGGAEESRQAVDLGSVEAYKYIAVRLSGLSGELNLYATPTKEGSTVFACTAPSVSEFGAQCEAVALTLQVTGGEAAPLGPNKKLAGELKGILDELNGKVSAGVKKVQAAKAAAGQASTTKQVAKAYHDAGKKVLGLEKSAASFADAQLIPPLGKALRGVGSDYDDLSRAYARKRRGTAEDAKAAIAKSQQNLESALKAFADAGYKVEG